MSKYNRLVGGHMETYNKRKILFHVAAYPFQQPSIHTEFNVTWHPKLMTGAFRITQREHAFEGRQQLFDKHFYWTDFDWTFKMPLPGRDNPWLR